MENQFDAYKEKLIKGENHLRHFKKSDWDLREYKENYDRALIRYREFKERPYEANKWSFRDNPQTEYQKNILKWEEEHEREMQEMLEKYRSQEKGELNYFF